MDVNEVLSKARDAITVQRVFGEPYSKDGVTVIPVARVSGGGGGGSGPAGDFPGPGQPTGSGLGFGMGAAPAGVYVIKGDTVSWQPALDINRAILGGQAVAIVMFLTLRSLIRARSRRLRAGPRRERLRRRRTA